jgi:hypothetical protein
MPDAREHAPHACEAIGESGTGSALGWVGRSMWPWNKNKDASDTLEVVEHFMAEAEAALRSSDKDAIARARLHLDAALGARGDAEDATGTVARANKLLEQMEAIARPMDATGLTACPCCGGRELLVAENASIDSFYVGSGGAPLKFAMIVCRGCGDMRMRCTDLAGLAVQRNVIDAKCFRPVVVPAEPHPYRAR